MRITVSPETGGSITVMPQSNHLPVPIYNENEKCLLISYSEFHELESCQQRAEQILSLWSQKREAVVKQLLEMAFELDGVQFKCNVSTTVGSSVGIASGAAVIGGMILMPAVAIGGLIVGTAAATSNLVTGVIKLRATQKRAHQAKILFEEDKDLLESVDRAIDAFQLALENVIKNTDQMDLPELNHVGDAIGIAAIECTTNVVMCGARLALRETAAVSSNVLKGVVHAAAGIGIVLDLVTVILTAKSLATGSRCELAAQLRELAEKLETERIDLHRTFISNTYLEEEVDPLQAKCKQRDEQCVEEKIFRGALVDMDVETMKKKIFSDLSLLLAGSDLVSGHGVVRLLFSLCRHANQSSVQVRKYFTVDEQTELDAQLIKSIPHFHRNVREKALVLGEESLMRLRTVRSGIQFLSDDLATTDSPDLYFAVSDFMESLAVFELDKKLRIFEGMRGQYDCGDDCEDLRGVPDSHFWWSELERSDSERKFGN